MFALKFSLWHIQEEINKDKDVPLLFCMTIILPGAVNNLIVFELGKPRSNKFNLELIGKESLFCFVSHYIFHLFYFNIVSFFLIVAGLAGLVSQSLCTIFSFDSF